MGPAASKEISLDSPPSPYTAEQWRSSCNGAADKLYIAKKKEREGYVIAYEWPEYQVDFKEALKSGKLFSMAKQIDMEIAEKRGLELKDYLEQREREKQAAKEEYLNKKNGTVEEGEKGAK